MRSSFFSSGGEAGGGRGSRGGEVAGRGVLERWGSSGEGVGRSGNVGSGSGKTKLVLIRMVGGVEESGSWRVSGAGLSCTGI